MRDSSKTRKLIGKKIKAERLQRNLTADELASALGITPGYVGMIERGQRGTSVKLLLDICQVFDIDAGEFLSDKKLILSDNKFSSGFRERTKTINSLLRTLNTNELDFVIATIRSLNNMRIKNAIDTNRKYNNTDCESDPDTNEKFY